LSIGLTAAYAEECAVGPEYWCKSFENAKDCGALRHCTDTVWSYDTKYAAVDSSTTCQWCKRILGNIYQGLGDNQVSYFYFKKNLTNGFVI
jgi:saposin